MDISSRINYVNKYLKDKFGERTLKICIDAGFTCPNRDGSKSFDGCIFCSENGSGEHLKSNLTIYSQIDSFFKSYKIERANAFILYFQNFSNTYGEIETLKSRYDSAIDAFNKLASKYTNHKRLVGIQIATRPDCINEEIVELLESYSNNFTVTVELGLQTSNDENNFLNRCYNNDDIRKAVSLLRAKNIDVVVHVMLGLPTPTGIETHKDIENTTKFINSLDIQGIKIHSCYVVKNTKLEKLFYEKKYTPLNLMEYLEELSYVLTHISPDLIIHRISGDAPKDILVAPDWNTHKKWIINGIYKKFTTEDLWQGKFYKSKNELI